MGRTITIDKKQFAFSCTKDHPDIFLALRVLHDNSFCYEDEKYIFTLDPMSKKFLSAQYLHKVIRVGFTTFTEGNESNLEMIHCAITIANDALKEYELQIATAGEVTHQSDVAPH